jgi:hydroxymethylpyrimidine pyrophosphatase-like HAD family hydrolase
MKVLAFDLDDTLITDGRSTDAVPTVNRLFEDPNNFIVIYTARSYSIFHATRALLAKHGIKYHALVMEKIRADVYIDDKGVTYEEGNPL